MVDLNSRILMKRDTALDLLRALTMTVMIFVNDLWRPDRVPHWLGHAASGEDFMGLADVVFPLFLFVVGMSVPLAVGRRREKGLSDLSTVGHVFSRTFALLVMGVFIVNSEARLAADVGYPIGVYRVAMVAGFMLIWNTKTRWFWQFLGALVLGWLAFTFRDPRGGAFAVRWWGILGLIGWSYLFGALVYLFTRDNLRKMLFVLGGVLLICVLGTPMRGGEALLSFRPLSPIHLGNGATAALVMGGIVFSVVARRLTTLHKLLLAAGFAVLGAVAHRFWIVSKISATPTWIFYIFALAVAAYTLLGYANEKWFAVVKPAGTATLTCYLVPYLLYAAFDLTGFAYSGGLWICVVFAFVTIGVTWALGRAGIKLKI